MNILLHGQNQRLISSLAANEVVSKPYRLEVSPTPVLLSFDMYLDYPAYTGKSDESITNNGNATLPEGTILKWDLLTKSTDSVAFAYKDTLAFFEQKPAQLSVQ